MQPVIITKNGPSSEITNEGYQLSLKEIKCWLISKAILNRNSNLLSYRDNEAWSRKGVETYGSSFEIEFENNGVFYSKMIFLKAIITIPPKEILESWSNRRKILSANGIPVSNWYFYGRGIIIEDFYAFDFQRTAEFTSLLSIARKLDLLGFSCLNFLQDIRCDRYGNPFYVDFGFDLGEESIIPKTNSINLLKKTFPDRVHEIDLYLKID